MKWWKNSGEKVFRIAFSPSITFGPVNCANLIRKIGKY